MNPTKLTAAILSVLIVLSGSIATNAWDNGGWDSGGSGGFDSTGDTMTGTITFDGADPDITVTSGENIDLTLVGTSYLDINQGADVYGARVNGYDDRSASWAELNLDSSGNAKLASSNALELKSGTNQILKLNAAGTGDYDVRTDAGTTFQVGDGTYSWGHSPEFGVEGAAEFDSVLWADGGVKLQDNGALNFGLNTDLGIAVDDNGTGAQLVRFTGYKQGDNTLAILFGNLLNPNNMTTFDGYLSPTLVLANDEGADAQDFSYVAIGARDTADVAATPHYFDILSGTSAYDGSADGTTAETGAVIRTGNAGTETNANLDAGDWLFEDDVYVAGDLQASMKVTAADADGETIATIDLNTVRISSGAGDWDLPADSCDSATGNWLTVVANAAHVASITSLDTSDVFVLTDGTALTADDELDTAGSAWDSCTVLCVATNTWLVTGERGTCADGGVAD